MIEDQLKYLLSSMVIPLLFFSPVFAFDVSLHTGVAVLWRVHDGEYMQNYSTYEQSLSAFF